MKFKYDDGSLYFSDNDFSNTTTVVYIQLTVGQSYMSQCLRNRLKHRLRQTVNELIIINELMIRSKCLIPVVVAGSSHDSISRECFS